MKLAIKRLSVLGLLAAMALPIAGCGSGGVANEVVAPVEFTSGDPAIYAPVQAIPQGGTGSSLGTVDRYYLNAIASTFGASVGALQLDMVRYRLCGFNVFDRGYQDVNDGSPASGVGKWHLYIHYVGTTLTGDLSDNATSPPTLKSSFSILAAPGFRGVPGVSGMSSESRQVIVNLINAL